MQNLKKSDDTTATKVKDWMPSYVLMDFEDCNKQKHLVALAVLPTGVTHYNTTNTGISAGGSN